MKLYDYYQSSSAYRVRIALNLKGIDVERVYINLTKGEQREEAYAGINPQMQLPSLVLGEGEVLTQSLAIIEYLDGVTPESALLPIDPVARAQARAIAMAVAIDIAPINNLKIRKFLASELHLSAEDVKVKWIQHWIEDGFAGIEAMLAQSPHTGEFCIGDTPTIADCCLIPQVFNAKRWECNLAPFPTIRRIAEHCDAHPAFAAAHPLKQPDAPQATA